MTEEPKLAMGDYVDIVFDGPPGLKSGRLVEVEDSDGFSIRIGEWSNRGDGYWVLRIPDSRCIAEMQSHLDSAEERIAELEAALQALLVGGKSQGGADDG